MSEIGDYCHCPIGSGSVHYWTPRACPPAAIVTARVRELEAQG